MDNKSKHINHKFIITEKGSLGILAMGDIGLREWRKVIETHKKDALNEKK